MFFSLIYILVGYSLLQDGPISQNAQHLHNVTLQILEMYGFEILNPTKNILYIPLNKVPPSGCWTISNSLHARITTKLFY